MPFTGRTSVKQISFKFPFYIRPPHGAGVLFLSKTIHGGGVFTTGNSVFEINGGDINGNVAAFNGDGVYTEENSDGFRKNVEEITDDIYNN